MSSRLRITKNEHSQCQQGFTLIEIIVVLIIVGILSSLALTALFRNITKSRGAEAIASLSGYKALIEPCLVAHKGQEQLCAIDLTDTPNFTYAYTLAPDSANPETWTIMATLKSDPTATLSLIRTP